MTYSIHSLTDAELLAMLLNIPIDTAREIYGRLLPENKKAILGMSIEELSQLKGMGRATCHQAERNPGLRQKNRPKRIPSKP